MSLKLPWFVGDACLQSNLTLEEVGKILSERVFAGLAFSGRELAIYDEVPAILIPEPIMGLRVVLDGYSGFGENEYFNLSVAPWISISEPDVNTVRLDKYLTEILKISLIEVQDKVKVLESTD